VRLNRASLFFQGKTLIYTEAMLFIYNHQAQPKKPYRLLEQGVRSNRHLRLPTSQSLPSTAPLSG
jgi:hypothetical protein